MQFVRTSNYFYWKLTNAWPLFVIMECPLYWHPAYPQYLSAQIYCHCCTWRPYLPPIHREILTFPHPFCSWQHHMVVFHFDSVYTHVCVCIGSGWDKLRVTYSPGPGYHNIMKLTVATSFPDLTVTESKQLTSYTYTSTTIMMLDAIILQLHVHPSVRTVEAEAWFGLRINPQCMREGYGSHSVCVCYCNVRPAIYFIYMLYEHNVPLGFLWRFQHACIHCVDFTLFKSFVNICWPSLPWLCFLTNSQQIR